MVPEPLIDKLWDDDRDSLRITRIEYNVESMLIMLCYRRIAYNDSDKDIKEYWRVDIQNPVKYYFEPNMHYNFTIEDEHPILWEYNDEQVSLYFTGECSDIAKLHYDLYQTHLALTTRYVSFTINLALLQNKKHLFKYTNGLLAKGSQKLLTQYATCMELNGLDYSIIGGYRPYGKPKKALFFFDGYVVAEEFSFSRVEE